MDPKIQVFAIELSRRLLPEVERIVELYIQNPEVGFSAYLDLVKDLKPSMKKIIVKGLRDPLEAGLISSRLLRDPLDAALTLQSRSSEEKEAHLVGYLKAFLQIVYCCAKGLEGYQFSETLLYEESMKVQTIGKPYTIPPLVKIVRQELSDLNFLEQPAIFLEEDDEKSDDLADTTTNIGNGKILATYMTSDEEKDALPFTARLMAYYRFQEYKSASPLIIDPFAERLAGDMTAYADKHKFVVQRGDYALVRSYFIENTLLNPWCMNNKISQIILLGAGLDTRAYRLKNLKINSHTIFEIDLSSVIEYKEAILKDEKPLCNLVRVSEDLSSPKWDSSLRENGFSTKTPTFWVLEGLAYYLEKQVVVSLLQKAALMSTETSEIFVDICVPALADLVFGPFTPYFKWGLDKKTVPSFFESAGWSVTCSFADDHDQGRDVGQRGLIFVSGVRI
ncbi:MAG: class I SAM-dependent methyltransferase [Candidatus Heimdallarchaeota archaeon]|nr:MAG: class I SAM-dependent methyltransferase [Candidatus Heimdallarchaeota archaeon]